MRSAIVLCFSLFFAAGVSAQPSPSVHVEPAGDWVSAPPLPALEAPVTGRTPGTEWLLRDDQIRVDDETVHYSRRALVLRNTAGVQNWQEIEIDFDPTFQQLVLHHVRLVRDGVVIDALRPDEVRVIQRETDLAERIYDGRMTALLFVHDLRPGDVIDYAWSLAGTNPIVADSFAHLAPLTQSEPTRLVRWRILHPRERDLRSLVLDSDAEIARAEMPGGWVEQKIVLESPAPIQLEDQLPVWLNPIPRVQTSEFATWTSVALWAERLFSGALGDGRDEALDATVRMLGRRGATAEERALAAIRFVQDEIRYLGIESGPNSHTPHAPSLVLSRRFGDCKDKALLLVQLLERFGFDARVALVDSGGGRDLARMLPSPFVFDHAIVTVRDGENQAWIDATLSDTGGELWSVAPPPLDVALIVEPSTTGLSQIPDRTRQANTHVVEKWTLAEDGGARFDVRSSYEGADADELRSYLATLSLEELGEQYHEYYAQSDPGIEPAGLPSVEDDRSRNVIVVTEAYRLAKFWSDSTQRELWAHVIGNRLVTPASETRTNPLGLVRTGKIVHEIEVEGTSGLSFPTFAKTIDNDVFRLQARSWRDGDRLHFRCVWEPRKDTVAPGAVAQYAASIGDAEQALSLTVTRGMFALAGLAGLPSYLPPLLAGGAAAAGGSLLLVGFAVSRRRRSAPEAKAWPRVARIADVSGLPSTMHCGVEGIPVSGSGRTVGQDASGAPLVRLAVVCPLCLRSRPITVVIAAANPEPGRTVDPPRT